MVSLCKCKFLTKDAAILGPDLHAIGFVLGLKLMGSLPKVVIQANLHELQCLVGELVYISQHVPHFKKSVKPIETLLS